MGEERLVGMTGNRRVFLVDGKPKNGGKIIAEQVYPPDQAIIIDIRKIKDALESQN